MTEPDRFTGPKCPVCCGTEWLRLREWATRFRCIGCDIECWQMDGFMVQAAEDVPVLGSDDRTARERLGPQVYPDSEWPETNRVICNLLHRRDPD